MTVAQTIVVGGAVIAAVASDAFGMWAAGVPVSAADTSLAGQRGVVAANQPTGGTRVALPVQQPGLDPMAGKRRRRSG